jgi:ketosteroid isomerase-like protein
VSTAKRIFRDLDSGLRSGVNGTPTFYVQGIRQDIDEPGELHAKLESALTGDLAALWPPIHKRVDRHVEIARLWHDGLARGDVSASAQLWADDIDWQGWNDELPGGGAATGRDAVEQLHRRSRPASPWFRILAHDYIQHGNRVLVIGEVRSDALDGGFHLPYVQIWEMEAGKAKCVHTLTDTLAIARALGEAAVARAAPAT